MHICTNYTYAYACTRIRSVRGIMHLRFKQPVVPGANTTVALRMPSDGIVLDQSHGYKPAAGKTQTNTQRQCFRFLDSQSNYLAKELNVLLRAIQENRFKFRSG